MSALRLGARRLAAINLVLAISVTCGLLGGGAWPALASQDICPEPNDTPETACATAGGMIAGNLDSTEDVDRYRVEVTEGQSLRVTLASVPNDFTMRLERADGSVVSEGAGSRVDGRTLTADKLPAGTYFVQVVPASGTVNAALPYTLTVNVQSPAAPAVAASTSAPPSGGSNNAASGTSKTTSGISAGGISAGRTLDELILRSLEVGPMAKSDGKALRGEDSRASWAQLTYKRDSDPKVTRLGPQYIVNRVYRAVDEATAREIFREQSAAGLPEAVALKLNYGSLGPRSMDPIGEEGVAFGACEPCGGDKPINHFRIVFRMSNLVETLYTYGPDTGNYFGVAYDLAKTVEKRVNTPPEPGMGDVFSTRDPADIALHPDEVGKEMTQMLVSSGATDRSQWFESRYERGDEYTYSRLGPNHIYNKVWVARDVDAARGIFKENSIQDLPEATKPRSPIFVEDRLKGLGNEIYAIGACNTDCNSSKVEDIHSRAVIRAGNVVMLLYIWGAQEDSNSLAMETFAKQMLGRLQ